MIDRLSNALNSFNWRLYLVILLTFLIPSIYSTIRIYYLGELPNDQGFDIASQILWLSVALEVIQEGLLLPLFFLIGLSANKSGVFTNRVITGFLTVLVVYAIPVLAISIWVDPILVLMKQNTEQIELTAQYIRLEAIAFLLSVAFKFAVIIFIVLNRYRKILQLLVLQTILAIIFDTFFLSQFSYSLNLGVKGIGWSNIISSVILLFVSYIFLKQAGVLDLSGRKLSFNWIKGWFKIGGFSSLESLVRNTVFILVILRLINETQSQADFWISNSFIWSWLILPVLALGEIIKRDVGINNLSIKSVLSYSILITTITVLIWFLSVPIWDSFFVNILNIETPDVALKISLVLLLFYVVFAFNNILDSIFYGLGRTDIMLLQAVVVNVVYYGVIYLLFELGLLAVSLNNLVLIFGIGMAFDALVTVLIYKFLEKKRKLSINIKY